LGVVVVKAQAQRVQAKYFAQAWTVRRNNAASAVASITHSARCGSRGVFAKSAVRPSEQPGHCAG